MSQNLHIYIITAVALAAGLLSFFVIQGVASSKDLRFPNLTGDSNHYMVLAEHLIEKQAFDTYPEKTSPEIFRTPGYPLFLVLLFSVFGSWKAAALVQALLMAGVPLFTYFLGKRIFSENTAFAASIVTALDPTRLFFSTLTLADGIFTLLLLLSILLLFGALDSSGVDRKKLFFSGLFLGYAVLVRPIGQFLPFLYLGYLFLKLPQRKLLLKVGVVFLIPFVIIVGSWMLRNKIVMGTWQLSTVRDSNLAYFAALYLKEKEGVSPEFLMGELAKKAGDQDSLTLISPGAQATNREFARSVISSHPLSYLKFHLVKTVPFFLNDGLRDIERTLHLNNAPLPNITSTLLKGDLGAFWDVLKSDGRDMIYLLVGSGILSLIFLGVFLETLRGLFEPRRRIFIAFFALFILYFALLTGPIANARYRLPASPLLFLLGIAGLGHFFSWICPVREKSLRNIGTEVTSS